MHSKTEKNQNNYSTFLTFKLNFMKRPTKLLTALLALFIAFPSLKAGNMQVYTAGDLPTSAGTFVAPDFFGGAGWSYRSRTMDPAKKDTAFFPNVLGVTDGVAYGIEISKTQDDPGNIFLSLNLHSCDSIIVAGWGTGGRGILVTNSANTDSSWKGASSYNLIQVPVKVGTDSPVEIKITPTGKDTKNSTSNGGTWITRIVVFAKEGSEVTQYYLSNPGFESPDTTLLVTTKNSGIWIPKGWTVDYPTFNEWDQGIVTSLNDAGGSALPLIAQEGSNFYYGRLRWATNLISLKQDMINPPAGYNVVSMEVASPDGYKAQLAVSTDADTVTESPTGTGWETIDLVFAGEEGKNATFSATASSASGAAQNRMFLDDARMVAYGTNFPPSVLDQRTALIAEANALYGDGSGEGAAALQEAINAFEAVPTTCALGPAETMMAALVALQTAGAELQAAMYDFNVANASPTNPMDLTSKVVNPSANQGRTGWNWSFSSAVQNQGIGTDALFTKATPPYFEAWTPASNKPMTGRIYQIITDLPNGKYELTVAAQGKGGATDNLHVYANDALSGIFVDTVITVPFMVTAGTAEIGIKAEAADVNWIAIDEIHLSYLGFDPAAMIDALNAQIAEADSLLTLKMKESVATELTNARTNAAAAVAASPAVKSQLEAAGAEMAAALPAANASIAGYATLKAAIEASEAKYNAEAPGAADFRAAIDAAQAAWDAAKIDPAVQITALAVANNAFDFAAASETNPVVTNLVVNPTFDTNTLGWSTTTGANNTGIASNQQGDFTVPFWENWSPNNFTGKMYQVIENVPNGDYLLKAAVFCNNGGSGLYLYANDDKVLANTTAPTYHEVMTRVTDNRLEIGIIMEEATNNWVGIDNVSLTYYNFYPSFTKTATGASVKTAKELLDALKYNDYAIGDVTIELQDCADEGGIYLLGSSGFVFPQTGGDLTIKAAEGAKPQIWGSFSSTNGMKVNNITFEGLYWNGGDSTLPGFNAEAYQPFGILRADSVLGDYTVRNCTFENLDYQRIFRSNNCAGAVVKKVVFEYNDFDNMGWNRPAGSHGQTFIQMVNSNNYEMDHFVFRENFVMNFHGNQLFNMPRKGTTADSAEVNFSVTIENNTFYRLGGHGNSERNFLEYNQNLGGLNGVININNNVIYDRWSGEKFPQSKLALFTPAEGQNLTVNILNNFFYPDTVVTKDPVYTPEDTTYYPNLRLDPVIDHNRNDLFLSDFPGLVLVPGELLSYKSPLYTAGTEGTYVGALSSYYVPAFIEQPTGAIVKNLAELTEALAYTDYESADITIELMNCTDEGGVYLLGNSGFAFPQTGGDLTIKNAEGQNPVLAGRLTSNNGVKAATLLYEGLEFNAQSVYDAYNTDTYSPLYMTGIDSVMVGFNVRNCLFTNLPFKQLILSANKIANYAVIKDFVMEHCVIKDVGVNQDTMAQHSGHMFQLSNKKTYEFDHFTFRNNIVNNWRNSQVFNINRDGTTADSTDVNFVVTIENNLFYKFGGNATNVRNFLEYTKSLGGLTGVININNNIFYERGSQAGFPHAKLTMFLPAPGQSVTLNVLNNFFYPDNVVKDESTPENYPNLRLVGPAETDITFSRNDLFMDSFEGLSKVFRNEARLTISKQSPLFEAGTGGSFIGPEQIYVGNAGTPVIAFLTKQKTMAATAATVENDPVYLMMAADDNFIVDQIVLTDVSATSPVDLDAYDIALVQESFGGGDKILTPAGPLGLAKFDLPVLYNKTYAFKAGRALASGQPGSGAEQQGLSITVDPAQQGNDLFKGLTFADDNTLTLFKAPAMDDGTLGAEKSIKALNYAKEVVLSSENTPIAIPTGVTDAVIFINDLPAGTVVGGETLAERMITVGFNFGAMCADNGTNMTNAAFTIWRNALYMLAGMEVPSDPYDALPQTDGVQKNVVFTMGGNLYVQATEQTNINIYNVMGALVRTVRLEQGLNTIEGLSQGQIYVVKIDSEAIKVVL